MGVLKNPKHELYAQGLAKGKSQAASYGEAGYRPNDGAASRLAGNVKIAARVDELKERAAEKAEITIADIARQLDEDRTLAHTVEQAGAAVSATLGKAKVLGFLRDKVELTGKDGGPLEYREAARQEIEDMFGPTGIEVIPKIGYPRG